jgi:hypothetical protein
MGILVGFGSLRLVPGCFGMTTAIDSATMKTFYFIKSILPFIFLPIAPGMIQLELERQGLVSFGSGTFFVLLMQIAFTLGIIVWLGRVANQKRHAKGFLKMSCVSKKVLHQGRWMSVEQYLAEFHNIVVSHGMTPEEATAWITESEEWLQREKLTEAFDGLEITAHQSQAAVLVE